MGGGDRGCLKKGAGRGLVRPRAVSLTKPVTPFASEPHEATTVQRGDAHPAELALESTPAQGFTLSPIVNENP